MRYTTEIIINLPRNKVVHTLDEPANMKHWQRGLLHYEPISGPPGQEGSQMELHFRRGKGKMVLIETIIKRNFPYEFHATYDTKGVNNIQKNYFKEIDEQHTQWVSETDFEFSGLFMKLIGFLMPGAFKNQSRKYMEDFKAFAESGVSVSSTNPHP